MANHNNKNIKQFLPRVFQTDKIKNVMDSTSETLFTEKKSDDTPFYIGRKIGGLYDPLKDNYAEEIRKIREDYQLEPTLILRDLDTREVNSVHFYEDLLNDLNTNGSFVDDHKKLFKNQSYSYAPPIDMDKFVNFTNYYWYPEGALAFRVNANPSDIIGSIEYQAEIIETNEAMYLSSGHHVILNDDKEYIVEGVGRYIELIEFSFEDNIPKRVDRVQDLNEDVEDIVERFPAEYITMERGALDENPWSRNNSWYHIDVINLSIGDRSFRSERARQAKRPIIEFKKDIELYNYSQKPFKYVRLFGDQLSTAIDGVIVRTSDLVVQENDPSIYQFDGNQFNVVDTAEDDSKITILDGSLKADEFKWNSDEQRWDQCQAKTQPTQAPLFNLYDSSDSNDATLLSDDFRYPQSDFEGNKIFSYDTDFQDGIRDEVLGLNIVYKSFQESSDIVFRNFMEEQYEYVVSGETKIIPNQYYKQFNPNRVESNNIYMFTIHPDDDSKTIYVNDDKLPNIILKGDTQYRFDVSDTTTTPRGWNDQYTSITVKDNFGNTILGPIHGDSSKNIKTISFPYDTNNEDNNVYTYTDGLNEGNIFIVDDVVDEILYKNTWELKSNNDTVLMQDKEFMEDSSENTFEFEYIPKNHGFIVELNGDILSSNVDYTYENGFIELINDDFSKGDYIKVTYQTFEDISNPKYTKQLMDKSLSNNPFNDDVIEFAFSEMFNHFRSIINNQVYIEGSSLSDNNFRDTLKNNSLGNVVLKHENFMVPLAFITDQDSTNLVSAIQFITNSYDIFKNTLVLRAEELLKQDDINSDNVRVKFDDILSYINAGKTRNNVFAQTNMLATYRRYSTIIIDSNYKTDQFIDIEKPNNALYIYTDDGLQIINEDYTVDSDYMTLETTITPITFNNIDITEIRYYEDMEPSFCPATPAKFGLEKPEVPRIELDESFSTPRYFIIGHDGSKVLAYSSEDEINNAELDGRDLILLEFEKRIFNGINEEFKESGSLVFDYNTIKEGKFRKTDFTLDQINSKEFSFFHKWTYNNNVNYTKNTLYTDGDPFTFNYSKNKDLDGEALPGHWKAIYEYYYDTHKPHEKPWEMLGFSIKPSWWENEYGTDYSTNNTQLWNDLEEGIIRQGSRMNVDFYQYKNRKNPYRREGLSNVIPVDSNGDLLSPIDIGITNEPSYLDAQSEWKYGDMGPVEQAWKRDTMYSFVKQMVYFIINPLDYVSKAWDTEKTFDNKTAFAIKPRDFRIHYGQNTNFVPGITQWLGDRLIKENESVQRVILDSYNGMDVVLGHKTGGFVDAQNLRVVTESFNPRSGNVSSAIPDEDVSVVLHQSKNISDDSYSGVFVERVRPSTEQFNYEKGGIYDKNDIIYNVTDKNYYKNVFSHFNYPEWSSDTTYIEGRVIRFDNTLYVCIQDHLPRSTDPENSPNYWEVRGFVDTEWALMMTKPDVKTTHYKVYGYDLYDPNFYIIPKKSVGRTRTITSLTNKSRKINVQLWQPNTYYESGTYTRLDSGRIQKAIKSHTSGVEIDNSLWSVVHDVPYENLAKTRVTLDGQDYIEKVPYGTVFRTQQEVSEFLAAYSRYLEHRGWLFDTFDSNRNEYNNWFLSVKEFIRWEYENKNEGAVISLSPASMNVKFKPVHGVPSVSRDFDENKVTLMDNRSRIITPSECEILRLNNEFSIEPPRPLYYTRLNVRETEHVLVFNNTTIFNDVIFKPVYGIRKERLFVNTRKTTDWDGTLSASGFIISDNKLLPNFETSINDLRTISDIDTVSTQDALNTLKYHNLGYERRDYLENIEMGDESQIQFYSGFIKQKGTSEAFQRMLRSEQLNADENMGINEEWAFKEQDFGGVVNDQTIEFFIDKSDFVSSPQPILLEYNKTFEPHKPDTIYVNKNDKDKWIMSPTRFAENGELWSETRLKNVKRMPTAGYVRYSDADYKAFDLTYLNQKIRRSTRNVTEGSTAWVAVDTREEYGFNIYKAQEDTTIVVNEIISHGSDGTSSMVLRLDNVVEDAIYGFYSLGYTFTFQFKKIDPNDNLYIAVPFNTNEFNVIDSSYTVQDLNDSKFYIWKSLRINKFYEPVFNDINDTINTFIQNHNLVVENGMNIYLDDARGDASYKEVILGDSPYEYWTLNEFINGEFEGEQGNVNLVPDDSNSIDTNVQGMFVATSGVSGEDNYTPSNNVWPDSLWGVMGNMNHENVSLEFWVKNTGEMNYQYSQSVSTTIAGYSFIDSNDDVYVVQLMIDPPMIGSDDWEYKVVYMVNNIIEKQEVVNLEEGFNHFVINYQKVQSNESQIVYDINGLRFDTIVANTAPVSTTSDMYVIAVDTAEEGSNMPVIDHMAFYTDDLPLLDVQNHYSVGVDGIFSDNDSGHWAVYKYDGTQWVLDYKESKVINTDLISNVTIYSSSNNAKISNLHIHDPIKGYFPGSTINYIDYMTEYDPVKYNSDNNEYSYWLDEMVGTLWLDTSKLRYIEYENFDIETRDTFWGNLFPDSEVCVYEWIKSRVKPEEIERTEQLIDTESYVTGIEYDVLTDSYIENYYFWFKNNTAINENIDRSVSASSIANSIQFPENNSVGYVRFLSNDGISVVDTNNNIVENNIVLQINYKLDDDNALKHSQWTLLSENDNDVPDYLFDKMVDSLLGYTVPTDSNPNGLVVPDPSLSEFNKYGNSVIPRQTWFKDNKRARRIFFEVLNETLTGINVWDTELFWEDKVDGVQRDTSVYELIDWVKEDYNPDTIVNFQVDDRSLMVLEPVPDGGYIKVNESQGRMPSVYEEGTTVYRYHEDDNTYEKVFESRSALSLKSAFYERDLTGDEAADLRKFFDVIFKHILIGENSNLKQQVFFALIQHVFVEHPNNDWVYPTTYISINQRTDTLLPRKLYSDDKEDQLVAYVNEAKPFHTKLRTINRTHTRDPENAQLFVTDFDKPPFITGSHTLLNLQEFITEKIRYRPETYYYDKVIDNDPYEYWTLNSINDDSSFSGELGISDFTLQTDGVSTLESGGISSGNKVCTYSTDGFSYYTNMGVLPNKYMSFELWYEKPNDIDNMIKTFFDINLTNNNQDSHIKMLGEKTLDSNNNEYIAHKIVFENINGDQFEEEISIQDNTPNHIVIVKNTTDMVVYVNSVERIREQFDIGNVIQSNAEIWFGHESTLAENSCYDHIAFYNSILSSLDVVLHYNAGDVSQAENEFRLYEPHDLDSVEVYIEDQKVPSGEYTINNEVLRFNDPIDVPYNYYNNITVRSNNVVHQQLLNDYDKTRGYISVNKNDINQWKSLVNQKTNIVNFDRISLLPTFTLEELLESYDAILSSEKPLEEFSIKSIYNRGTKEQKYSEIDRIIVQYYYDELNTIVDKSFNERVSVSFKKNFNIGSDLDKDNLAVFVNGCYIDSRYYKVQESNGDLTVKMGTRVYNTETFTVRPKDLYEDMVFKAMNKRGMGTPYHSIEEIHELDFVINEQSYPVKLDGNGDLILDQDFIDEVEDAGKTAELATAYSEFTDQGDDAKNMGDFLNAAHRGVPEERVGLNVKQSMCLTFKSNLNIVPRGYETTKPLDIFETVHFVSDGTETEYPITLNVPEEQVMVIVDEDEWVKDYHYELQTNKIVFLKQLESGNDVTITDRYSAFDMYRGRQLFIHKNIQDGGYDGDMVLPDFLNTKNEFREFIIYDHWGKVFTFRSDEIDAIDLSESFTIDKEEIVLSQQATDKFRPVNNEHGKLVAIYAQELDNNDKLIKSFVEFVYYKEIDGNILKNITRGIFNTHYKDFDMTKYLVKAYPIDIDKELPMFTLVEPYIGIKGKESYPKYGHIMSGKD